MSSRSSDVLTSARVVPGMLSASRSVWSKPALAAHSISVASAAALALCYPRIGIRGTDAYAYVVGAYSIQQGNGFKDLTGQQLNHWPPGYSALLALFPDPLFASRLINDICFGCALALVYVLGKHAGWSRSTAACLTIVLGVGFFRQLATNAEPDILTYAGFLVGLRLLLTQSITGRLVGLAVFSLLIEFKFIALPFAIAALVTLAPANWNRELYKRGRPRLIAAGLIMWFLCTSGISAFNYHSAGYLISPTHPTATAGSFLSSFAVFPRSAVRDILSFWGGSILTPTGMILFIILLVFGLIAVSTLRLSPQNGGFLAFGCVVLIVSFGLLLIRDFDADARLLGYGLLGAVFAFRPIAGSHRRWLAYAGTAVVVAIAELASVSVLGLNDARDAALAQQIAAEGLPSGPVYTNAAGLLDLQDRVPTHPLDQAPRVGAVQMGDALLSVHVTWDAETQWVFKPLVSPGPGWCEDWQIAGAELFRRC